MITASNHSANGVGYAIITSAIVVVTFAGLAFAAEEDAHEPATSSPRDDLTKPFSTVKLTPKNLAHRWHSGARVDAAIRESLREVLGEGQSPNLCELSHVDHPRRSWCLVHELGRNRRTDHLSMFPCTLWRK
jgi:hypothetical protein